MKSSGKGANAEQHRAGMIDNNYSQLRKHTNPQIPKPQSQDQEEKNVRKYMMKLQKTKSTATESWDIAQW